MTLKSFFNRTVLKKDLTRFWPVWAGYLILSLLLLVGHVTGTTHQVSSHNRFLSRILGNSSVFLLVYALITAQLLFKDLYQSQLANAIHALPVRREGLFLTHYVAGMIIGLGSNLVFCMVNLLFVDEWLTPLLCWLALSMMYFLFFSIAVFCIMCTGKQFASIALYVLANSIAAIGIWLFKVLFVPLFHGMELYYDRYIMSKLHYLSPVVLFMNYNQSGQRPWILFEHSPTCNSHYIGGFSKCQYVVSGLGDIWYYLAILTALSIGISVAALLIYRKRPMENTGDFVIFKPLGIIFTLMGSFCIGVLTYLLMGQRLIGMLPGMVIGFFICEMLLKRTFKVFGKKIWLKLVFSCVAIAVSLGVTYAAVQSVVWRIPKGDQVSRITISPLYLSEYYLDMIPQEQTQSYICHYDASLLSLTDPAQIQDIQNTHRLFLQEGNFRDPTDPYDYGSTVTIHYELKNGDQFTRYYYIYPSRSEAWTRLQYYTNTAPIFIECSSPEALVNLCPSIYVYENGISSKNVVDPVWIERFAYALWEDYETNRMCSDTDYAQKLELNWTNDKDTPQSKMLYIPRSATSTLAWLKEYNAWCQEHENN